MERQPLQFPDDEWRRRWLVVLETYDLLHRVSSIDWNNESTLVVIPVGGEGETLCGQAGILAVPGILSRMGLPRCPECCRLAGVPEGDGAPYNSEGSEGWSGL
jgi:hypothetical protein